MSNMGRNKDRPEAVCPHRECGLYPGDRRTCFRRENGVINCAFLWLTLAAVRRVVWRYVRRLLVERGI